MGRGEMAYLDGSDNPPGGDAFTRAVPRRLGIWPAVLFCLPASFTLIVNFLQ